MSTLTKLGNLPTNETKRQTSLFQKYWAFCDTQQKNAMIWYIIPLFSLSSALMPMTFLALYMSSGIQTWHLAFSGTLLFVNIIPNISHASTRVTISIFLVTILLHVLMVALPLIA